MVLFVKIDLSTASNLSLENINPSDMPLPRETLQNTARETNVSVFFLHNSLSPLTLSKCKSHGNQERRRRIHLNLSNNNKARKTGTLVHCPSSNHSPYSEIRHCLCLRLGSWDHILLLASWYIKSKACLPCSMKQESKKRGETGQANNCICLNLFPDATEG